MTQHLTLLALLSFALGVSGNGDDILKLLLHQNDLDSSISDLCSSHIQSYLQAIHQGLETPMWALKMYDASGKWPDGLIDGNLNTEGSYSSCYEVKAVNPSLNGENLTSFGGRFCGMRFITYDNPGNNLTTNPMGDILLPTIMPVFANLHLTEALYFGLCVPDSCSREEIEQGLKQKLSSFVNGTGYQPLMFTSDAPIDSTSLDGWDWGFVAFLIATFLMLSIGTGFDLYFQKMGKQSSGSMQFVTAFSIYSNTKRLFDTTKRSTGSQLYCLNGMRWLSIVWIIVGHAYENGRLFVPYNNNFDFKEDYDDYLFDFIRVYALPVDTFFFMSGLLVMLNTLRELDALSRVKDGVIKTVDWVKYWLLFYLHRYLRISIVFAIIIGFHATLGEVMEFGRLSNVQQGNREWCSTNAAWSLLYVSNWVNRDEMCLGHTWFLSTEMQIFVFSPLIIYPMWRWSKASKFFASLILLLSFTIPVVFVAVFNWPITNSVSDQDWRVDWDKWNYQCPWMRQQPYIVGMMIGYIIHRTKGKEVTLTRARLWNTLGWTVTAITGWGVVYGIPFDKYFLGTWTPSRFEDIAYGGTHRFWFGCCLGYIVLACVKGYGGFINDFLSWEAFMPLAKIQYVTYLMHMTVHFILWTNFWYGIEYTSFMLGLFAIVCTFWTTIISVLIVLMFEMPLLTVEKLLLAPSKLKKS